MRLDVSNRREFDATAEAVQALDQTLPEHINDDAEKTIGPAWAKELDARAKTQQEQRLLADTADITVSEQCIRLESANKGRALSGGLTPGRGWAPVERGSRARQFRRPNADGYVIGPALRAILPKVSDMAEETGTRIITRALEGKRD